MKNNIQSQSFTVWRNFHCWVLFVVLNYQKYLELPDCVHDKLALLRHWNDPYVILVNQYGKIFFSKFRNITQSVI